MSKDDKELIALNKMTEDKSFKNRPDMMNILKRISELEKKIKNK
jgi:thiamine biosynthesis lipoprotein ApbE